MAKASTRTQQEIEQMIAAYEQSGLTRREYCEQQKVPLTSFDYYRHRHRKQAATAAGQLVKVELQDRSRTEEASKGFSLVLSQGRRIETNWGYCEQDLARLIRIVEAA